MEANEILDTNVVFYRKEGMITIFTVIEFPPCTERNFDILFPTNQDYAKAIEIATKLREAGSTIGGIDVIIAAMCLNRSRRLVTKDKDFLAVKDVFPEFSVRID